METMETGMTNSKNAGLVSIRLSKRMHWMYKTNWRAKNDTNENKTQFRMNFILTNISDSMAKKYIVMNSFLATEFKIKIQMFAVPVFSIIPK